MLVEMKKTTKGSNDGLQVKKYAKGEIYDLSESLASTFISMEVAVLSTKSMGDAPMNKEATEPIVLGQPEEASENESEGSLDDSQGDSGGESEKVSEDESEVTEEKGKKKNRRKEKGNKY